jgi:hypothetical protein
LPPGAPPEADAYDFYWVSAPNVGPFGVTNRTGKRVRAVCVSVICSFVAAYHITSWLAGKQDGFLGWNCWFVEVASEPLLHVEQSNGRSLAS